MATSLTPFLSWKHRFWRHGLGKHMILARCCSGVATA
jgi:hypothetical protein